MGSNDLIQKIVAINRVRLGLDTSVDVRDQLFSKTSGAAARLCVYGRMRPGGPDHAHLAPLGGEWTNVQYPGHLQGDTCTLDECPGFAWTPKGTWNDGVMLTATALGEHWQKLDDQEGREYVRLLTPVRHGDETHVANIYASRDASAAQLLMLDGMNVHDDVD